MSGPRGRPPPPLTTYRVDELVPCKRHSSSIRTKYKGRMRVGAEALRGLRQAQSLGRGRPSDKHMACSTGVLEVGDAVGMQGQAQ